MLETGLPGFQPRLTQAGLQTVTEKGKKLEIWDISIQGIVLSV